VKKLIERYIRSYIVKEVISKNIVKLKLLISMKIHSVVNVIRVVRYRKLVKKQKMEEPKPVEIDGIEK